MPDLEFGPYDERIRLDPFPVYARLREEAPVYRNDELDFWALSRHADVGAAMRDTKKFSSSYGPLLERTVWGPDAHKTLSFVAMDPPAHTRMRGLVSKVFTPRRVGGLEPRIREITRDHLAAALQSGGSFDFVADFAAKVPMDVISELVGVPAADRARIRDLGGRVAERPPGTREAPHESAEALFALVEYYMELIAERRRRPRADLLSALVEVSAGGTRLTDKEITAVLFLLLLAGGETTVRLLGSAWYWAWRHPEQRDAAFGGRIGDWIEETLRYDGPSQLLARTLTEDMELHGVRVPKGARILLLPGAANRDPRVFPEPDRYDLDRDTGAAIPFGSGPHYCLGASLARLEARVVLTELVARVGDYAVEESGLRPAYAIGVRGFAALPTQVSIRAGR